MVDVPYNVGTHHEHAAEVEGVVRVEHRPWRSRPVELRLAVSRPPSGGEMLRVRGRVPLRLSDFGVTVKSAQVLFVSISVRDEVTVVVDALLDPVAPVPRERR